MTGLVFICLEGREFISRTRGRECVWEQRMEKNGGPLGLSKGKGKKKQCKGHLIPNLTSQMYINSITTSN